MKYLLIILLSCASIIARAQSRIETISFGGNKDESSVSVMQLMDYPVLLLSDSTQKVVSYECTISGGENGSVKTIKIDGPRLNTEAMGYLRDMAGESGTLAIKKVSVRKGDMILDTPHSLELHFNQ